MQCVGCGGTCGMQCVGCGGTCGMQCVGCGGTCGMQCVVCDGTCGMQCGGAMARVACSVWGATAGLRRSSTYFDLMTLLTSLLDSSNAFLQAEDSTSVTSHVTYGSRAAARKVHHRTPLAGKKTYLLQYNDDEPLFS